MTIKLKHGDLIPNTMLTYICDVARDVPDRRKAQFQCACGAVIERDLHHVRFLDITSCGCYRKEATAIRSTKHGNAKRKHKTGAYRSWQAMHQRVKTDPNYINREICERWCGEQGFENFLADMGDRPDNWTIERLKNDLGYYPENCVWANKLTQANNTSTVVKITIDGESHTIAQWCRIKGISYPLYKQRVKRGWDSVKALTEPVDIKKSFKRK